MAIEGINGIDKIRYVGAYKSLQEAWDNNKYGGVEGDYITIDSEIYYWYKYARQWMTVAQIKNPSEPASTKHIIRDDRPQTPVPPAPPEEKPKHYYGTIPELRNIGEYTSLSDVYIAYPYGGVEGDYLYINGVKYLWVKSWRRWIESSRVKDKLDIGETPAPVVPDEGGTPSDRVDKFYGTVEVDRDVKVHGDVFLGAQSLRQLLKQIIGLGTTIDKLTQSKSVTNKELTDIKNSFTTLWNDISNLEGTLGEALKDGIISQAERKDLQQLSRNLDRTQAEIEERVENILGYRNIPENRRVEIEHQSKKLLGKNVGSIDTLQGVIYNAINDGTVSASEAQAISEAYAVFKEDYRVMIHLLEDTLKSLNEDINIKLSTLNDKHKALVERSYQRAVETKEMIDKLRSDFFSAKINPISVQTMQTIIGSPQLQFDFVMSPDDVRAIPFIYRYTKETDSVSIPQQYLHKRIYPDDKNTLSSDAPRDMVYTIPELEFTFPDNGQYYLYAEVTNEANFFRIDKEPLELTPERYLVGVIGKEHLLTTMYGFTEVTPGQLKTDLIRSEDGKSYWDLVTGKFATKGDVIIGDPKSDACVAYIDGVVYVKGATVTLGAKSTRIEDVLKEQAERLEKERLERERKLEEERKAREQALEEERRKREELENKVPILWEVQIINTNPGAPFYVDAKSKDPRMQTITLAVRYLRNNEDVSVTMAYSDKRLYTWGRKSPLGKDDKGVTDEDWTTINANRDRVTLTSDDIMWVANIYTTYDTDLLESEYKRLRTN